MKLLKWIRHIKIADRLPRLPRMYSTEYESRSIDDDTAKLMGMTAVRCPQGVTILQKRHKGAPARDLVYSLPLQRPQRPSRFKPWIRGLFNTVSYDPMKRYRPQRNRAKRFR